MNDRPEIPTKCHQTKNHMSGYVWDGKGVIRMDPKNEDRCSHTTIPPSKMMALAMELQLSNRGNASKIFRKAKEKDSNLHFGKKHDRKEPNSKLPELLVVSSARIEKQEPTIASHLQPDLVNADFVFRQNVVPPIEPGDTTLCSLNQLEQKLIQDIDVASLVGAKDNVIAFLDTDESDDEEQNADLCLNKLSPFGKACIDKQSSNRDIHASNNYTDTVKGNRETNQEQSSINPIPHINNLSSSDKPVVLVISEADQLCVPFQTHNQQKDNHVSKILNDSFNIDQGELKQTGKKRDAKFMNKESILPCRERTQSLSDVQNQNPEFRRTISQDSEATAMTTSSPTLSSSLFSLSSLKSVSSTSLNCNSTAESSRKVSVASNVNVDGMDTLFDYPNRSVDTASVRKNIKGDLNKYNPVGSKGSENHNKAKDCQISTIHPKVPLGHVLKISDVDNSQGIDESTDCFNVYRRLGGSRPSSPSRRVLCEYVTHNTTKEYATDSVKPETIVSKAVFPNSKNGFASPVLHFKRSSKKIECSGCFVEKQPATNGQNTVCGCSNTNFDEGDKNNEIPNLYNASSQTCLFGETCDRMSNRFKTIKKENTNERNVREIPQKESICDLSENCTQKNSIVESVTSEPAQVLINHHYISNKDSTSHATSSGHLQENNSYKKSGHQKELTNIQQGRVTVVNGSKILLSKCDKKCYTVSQKANAMCCSASCCDNTSQPRLISGGISTTTPTLQGHNPNCDCLIKQSRDVGVNRRKYIDLVPTEAATEPQQSKNLNGSPSYLSGKMRLAVTKSNSLHSQPLGKSVCKNSTEVNQFSCGNHVSQNIRYSPNQEITPLEKREMYSTTVTLSLRPPDIQQKEQSFSQPLNLSTKAEKSGTCLAGNRDFQNKALLDNSTSQPAVKPMRINNCLSTPPKQNDRLEKRFTKDSNYLKNTDRKKYMVGNKDEHLEKPELCQTSSEESGGVVEPPPVKVKDIRAMFKRGPDYENYAKPRSGSSILLSHKNSALQRDPIRPMDSNLPSNTGTLRHDTHDNQLSPQSQVTKNVMKLFQGALEIEKESSVKSEEDLRQQKDFADGSPTNMKRTTQFDFNIIKYNSGKDQSVNKPSTTNRKSFPFDSKNNVISPASSPSDFKQHIAQIKNESQEVESFDESLDKFYDVLNDLSSI